MDGMTKPEIKWLLHEYIGVGATGIVEGLSYKALKEFYPLHCELEINSDEFAGKVRERFEAILEAALPRDQAKIVRGVLKKFPPNSLSKLRTEAARDELTRIADRLEGVVETPNLAKTTDLLWRAIDDAKDLLRENGPISAVDRVHTAMHGYLKVICDLADIAYGSDPTIEFLFGLVREQHPDFKDLGKRSANVQTILRSFAKVLTAVNDIRNNASLAHPKELLEQDEAMLTINTAWTILHYLNAKIAR